jgi:hypothetical protein
MTESKFQNGLINNLQWNFNLDLKLIWKDPPDTNQLYSITISINNKKAGEIRFCVFPSVKECSLEKLTVEEEYYDSTTAIKDYLLRTFLRQIDFHSLSSTAHFLPHRTEDINLLENYGFGIVSKRNDDLVKLKRSRNDYNFYSKFF